MKPFKAWLLLDAKGTYVPGLYMTKRRAEEEASVWEFLRDARWRVVRVKVTPAKATR